MSRRRRLVALGEGSFPAATTPHQLRPRASGSPPTGLTARPADRASQPQDSGPARLRFVNEGDRILDVKGGNRRECPAPPDEAGHRLRVTTAAGTSSRLPGSQNQHHSRPPRGAVSFAAAHASDSPARPRMIRLRRAAGAPVSPAPDAGGRPPGARPRPDRAPPRRDSRQAAQRQPRPTLRPSRRIAPATAPEPAVSARNRPPAHRPEPVSVRRPEAPRQTMAKRSQL